MYLNYQDATPGEKAAIDQNVTGAFNWIGNALFEIQQHQKEEETDCSERMWCIGEDAVDRINAMDLVGLRMLLTVSLKMLAQMAEFREVDPDHLTDAIGAQIVELE